ncbi:protein FAM91A1, partial [Elysia marginata]
LYRRGLIYLEVPIGDDDCISVPPLEGFVMNRVLGDYFETLLYKIFVSLDEHTPVAELANVLQIDLPLVKVSRA